MTQGLQIWDANGDIVLDVTDRLTRTIGIASTGTMDGSFTIPEQSGTPFFSVEDTSQVLNRYGPGLWLSGRTVYWRFDTNPTAPQPRQSYQFRYGYF